MIGIYHIIGKRKNRTLLRAYQEKQKRYRRRTYMGKHKCDKRQVSVTDR